MRALSRKVAVVTGASRGIGKGIALALADEGATVYVTGRTVTPGTFPLPGTSAKPLRKSTVAAARALPCRWIMRMISKSLRSSSRSGRSRVASTSS